VFQRNPAITTPTKMKTGPASKPPAGESPWMGPEDPDSNTRSETKNSIPGTINRPAISHAPARNHLVIPAMLSVHNPMIRRSARPVDFKIDSLPKLGRVKRRGREAGPSAWRARGQDNKERVSRSRFLAVLETEERRTERQKQVPHRARRVRVTNRKVRGGGGSGSW